MRGETLRNIARHAGLRLVSGVVVLFASTAITFLALHTLPGSPVMALLGGPMSDPSPATVAAITHEFGLDKPLLTQYGIYLLHILHGNLGISYTQQEPVTQILAQQIWPTVQLTLASISLAWLLVLFWVFATSGRNQVLNALGVALETILAAIPQFWLGIVLLFLFAFHWRFFPPAGNDGLLSLVLPSLSLALPLAGFLSRVVRESLMFTLQQPFILSARTRGLSEWSVKFRHALRHSIIPGIGLSAWALGALIGNAVVTEVIFSRQGLGQELYNAVMAQDMPLVIGVTLVVTLVYVIASILADILYVIVDPRLSRQDR